MEILLLLEVIDQILIACFNLFSETFYFSIHFIRNMQIIILARPKNPISIFLVALARLWRENHGNADRNDERFQNAVKVYLECLLSGTPFLVQNKMIFVEIQNDERLN